MVAEAIGKEVIVDGRTYYFESEHNAEGFAKCVNNGGAESECANKWKGNLKPPEPVMPKKNPKPLGMGF